ncbi:MAG: hypothetical protein ACRD50_05600 [Candidatus Acidiferrales bacterium]
MQQYTKEDRTAEKGDALAKKPYQKPAFRHERVFETMALICSKVSTTQAQCKFNTKNS